MLYKQSNDTQNRTLIKQTIHLNYTQLYEIEVRFDSNGFLVINNTRIELSEEMYTKALSEVTNSESEDQVTKTGNIMHIIVILYNAIINFLFFYKGYDKCLVVEVFLQLLPLYQ